MQLSDLVISLPHASTFIPEAIRPLIKRSEEELLQEPDLYTDRIYRLTGPRIVEATVSRIIADVNRAPDEIYTHGRLRSQGVITLTQSHGHNVFFTDPSLSTMEQWVQMYHQPFHRTLHQASQQAAFIIDGHSMWSIAPETSPHARQRRPDICLGNRFFTTCDAATTQFFREFYERLGYDVAINTPFSGRYIVGTHCSRLHTPGLQIEINRALYMDEVTLAPNEAALKRMNSEFIELTTAFCRWFTHHRKQSNLTDLSH